MSQTAEPPARFFVAGGTLSVDAESYLERAADSALFQALLAGKFAYVLNSRQMGKSSLCVRTMKRLQEAGVWTAFVDLTKIGGKNATVEQWYAGIAVEIGKTRELRSAILAYWNENRHLSPAQRLFACLGEVILERFQQPVAIFIDEIDATRSLSFSADDFFAAIRECYNRRVQDPAYNRLTFCLLGVAVPSDLINSPTSTPFNIGERIYLRDFTLEEARPLSSGLGRNSQAILERVYYWTSGHPFLIQSLCSAIASDSEIKSPEDVDALVRRDLFEPTARETNINLADVGNRVLHAGDIESEPEKFRADLLSAYETARTGKGLPDDEANRVAALLKLSGIMRSDGKRLYVRNRIYEHVFDREWILDNMPGQEQRRQRRAFYLGVLRTGLISLIVVAAIAGLAFNSLRLARIASAQRDLARYEAYAADLNLMRTAYQDNDLILLSQLLDETKDSPSKNIEWYYWNAKLHDANYQINIPHGYGNVLVALDGKSVAISDALQQTASIYAYPDLHLIHRIGKLQSNEFLTRLGNRWAIDNLTSSSRLAFKDAITGQPIGAIELRPDAGSGASFSANAKWLAVAITPKGGHYPADLAVVDMQTFRIIHRLNLKNLRVNSQSVSADGRILADEEVDNESPTLAENYFQGRQIVVRNLESGVEIDRFPSGGVVQALQLSDDGHSLAFALANTAALRVRDVRAHRFSLNIVLPTVSTSQFSEDGGKLLTVGSDLAACLWDLKTGRLIEKERGAMAASMPRDASSIVVAGSGTRVYTSKAVDRGAVTVPNTWAMVIGINSKGWLVVNTGEALRFFDADSLKSVHPYVRLANSSTPVSTDANWRVAATAGGGSEIVNTGTDKVLCRIPVWCPSVRGMDVSSRRIASIDSILRDVFCYDRSGKEQWRYETRTAAMFTLSWSPDGATLAVGKTDGEVCLLDAETGKVRRTITGYFGSVNNLVFSNDGRKLAVGGYDFKVPVYDLAKDTPPVICRGHTATVEWLSFSPDGSRLATASDDGTARIWDPSTGKQMLQIDVNKVLTMGVIFHPDGQRFYVSDYTGTIRVYQAPRVAAR